MRLVVHCKRERFDVYVGRPSVFGNPFAITAARSRALAIAEFEGWFFEPAQAGLRELARVQLAGRVLGCWCAPYACHAEVLARYVNDVQGPRRREVGL